MLSRQPYTVESSRLGGSQASTGVLTFLLALGLAAAFLAGLSLEGALSVLGAVAFLVFLTAFAAFVSGAASGASATPEVSAVAGVEVVAGIATRANWCITRLYRSAKAGM